MIKKSIAALLCVMLTLSLAACSSAPDSETSVPPTTTTTATSAATTTMPATSTQKDTMFEEIVLVDNENICFKITSVKDDAIWGYTLKVYIENKTDKELMFTLDDVSVNGFMCDPYWAESVAPEKKSNTSISWLDSAFEENGITKVEDINFTLRVYDSNDFLAEDVLKETFAINP